MRQLWLLPHAICPSASPRYQTDIIFTWFSAVYSTMTKPNAPVFAPYLERPGHTMATHASRWFMIGSALALAACSSTPLPEWPATTSTTTSAQPSHSAPTRTTTPAPLTASVTPVASNTHLQALPYSAAIAALFPDPNERYSTPGLSEGRRSYTTNSELAELLRNLSQQTPEESPRLGLLSNGNAQSGTPIHTLIATQAKAITPLALDESNRPNVMIVAGQQGTDAAATEAVLVLSKELGAGGLLAPLLDKINIILVPRANPDGFDKGIAATSDGTDLRFDHLQLKTPEARFLAKLVRDYRPSVLLDASEFDAIEPTLQRFAAVRANDMGLQYAVTPNGHEFVTKAAREWLHQPASSALSQAGMRVDWVFEAAGNSAQNGFAMGTLEPTTLTNAASLKNVVSMEASSRGSDLKRTHLQRRVHSQVQAMLAVLQSAAQRATDLRQVNTYVTRDVASHACRSTLAVQAQPNQGQREITLVDAASAQLVQKNVPWTSSLTISNPRTRSNACGYWLSANAVQATERLGMMGVNVQRVAELSSIQTETYQVAPGTSASETAVHLARHSLEAAPGSYYVSMNQPLAFLAAAALEPDTPYSFYSTGVLGDLKEVARVTALPNIVFEEE